MRFLTHRLNIVLFVLALACALSVINATYEQRHLFIALNHAQNQAQQLRQEAARLQYEQGALSKTSRIENIALRQLAMEPVQSVQTQYLKHSALASASHPGMKPSTLPPAVSSPSATPVAQHAALSSKQNTYPAAFQHARNAKPSALAAPGTPTVQLASVARSRGAP